MNIDVAATDTGLHLTLDGQPALVLDDLYLVAWGERHRLRLGGLEAGAEERYDSTDEVGEHGLAAFPHTTRSLRHPETFRLSVRCYRDVPVAMFELLPELSRPVLGADECGGLRIGSLPGCERSVYVHQRVNEYGRDAVGWWWAQATFHPDPCRDNPWDWGLFCVWRTAERCGVLLPLCGGGAVARLRGEENGLGVATSGWCGEHVYPRLPLLLVAFGDTPGEAIDQAFAAAARLSEWSFRPREEKPFPHLFEHLGYSTWGALGRGLRERTLLEAAESLRQHGVPARWLLLDEGWQAVNDHGQLTGYDASTRRFPAGLAESVRRAQAAGGFRHVGVWATLQGAWGGVDPNCAAFSGYSRRFFRGLDGVTLPAPGDDGRSFWEDWLAHLSRAGIDFVKVDNQGSGRNTYLNRRPLGDAVVGAIRNVETAADASGMTLTAGMSLHTECLFGHRSTNVVRVSADIVPVDQRAAKLHLAHSVHVGAWVSRVAWPDYDAFPSRHVAARAFAVTAVLSGGPVTLCDPPGEHDRELIGKLCLSDGRLLLPAGPGEPPASRWFDDPLADETPLLVVNRPAPVPRREPLPHMVDAAKPPPVTFLGLANVGLNGLGFTAQVPLADLDLPAAELYAVTTHFGAGWFTLGPGEALEVPLAELDAELVSICPILEGQAVLGRRDLLLGACGCGWDDDDVVFLPEPGPILLYDEAERAPLSVNHEPLTVHDGPRELGVGECWRQGPWLLVHAPSTVFRMGPA